MTKPSNPKRPKRPSPGPRATPEATDSTTAAEPAAEPGGESARAVQGGTAAPVVTDEQPSDPGTARPVTAEDVAAEDVATISAEAAEPGPNGLATADGHGEPAEPEPAEPEPAEPSAAEPEPADPSAADTPVARRPEVPTAGDSTPAAGAERRPGKATGTLPPPWRRPLGRDAEPETASPRATAGLPAPTRSARGSGRLPSANRIPRPSTERFGITERANANADAGTASPDSDPESPDTGRASRIDPPTLGFRRPPGQGPMEGRPEPSQTPGGFPMSWPRGRRPRQASLQLKRLDPWSVLKIALVLAVVVYLVWMVAVGLLYGVLNGIGVWDRLNGQYADLVAEQGGQRLISAGRVFGVAALIGAVNSLLVAVGLSVGAFIYNVAADLVGGIELTLSERD